jgi:hypothetical protein
MYVIIVIIQLFLHFSISFRINNNQHRHMYYSIIYTLLALNKFTQSKFVIGLLITKQFAPAMTSVCPNRAFSMVVAWTSYNRWQLQYARLNFQCERIKQFIKATTQLTNFVPFSPGIHCAHIGLILQKPILYVR